MAEKTTAVEPVAVTTADGLTLEGELAVPDDAWGAMVLAHPHPRMGGTMRSIVVSGLFAALPERGVACLRFNFRGVGGSEGAFGEGAGERVDVVGALGLLHDIVEGLPVALGGWSFGADTILGVGDERHAGWFAVAPPLRRPEEMVAGADPRPTVLAVPQHDEFRPPDSAREAVAGWANTEVQVVAGADHFCVGRLDRVAALALAFMEALR